MLHSRPVPLNPSLNITFLKYGLFIWRYIYYNWNIY